MEPDSDARRTDLADIKPSGGDVAVDTIRWIGDATADAIRWIGDAWQPGRRAGGEHSDGAATSGVNAAGAGAYGNGNDHGNGNGNGNGHANGNRVWDDLGDDDLVVDALSADDPATGTALATFSNGVSGHRAHDRVDVESRSITTLGANVLEPKDLDAWSAEAWDDARDDHQGDRATNPKHLTLPEVLRVRSVRFIAVTMVVTFAALVMAAVLLWQRVEDTRTEVVRSKQVTLVPGLAGVHRRLNRLDTQMAAFLGSPNGDPTGRADAIQQQLTALNQCVAEFQRTVVYGTRVAVRYC